MRRVVYFVVIILATTVFCSCSSSDSSLAKPKTYLHLDIEEPNYIVFDTFNMPFTFSYPDYGKIMRVDSKFNNKDWFNIDFNQYGSTLFFTLINLSKQVTLDSLINDNYNIIMKQHSKLASGIAQREYDDRGNRVYGHVFEIHGSEIVSPYQFCLTDSSNYFLRGALYFNFKPNNDSISPIIDRLKIDMDKLISSLRWK